MSISADINFNKDIPEISFPGISQVDFSDAFNVLDECTVTQLPCNGFEYPFMGPGGHYGGNWWLRDSTLTLNGAKWIDQKFAENVLRNFILVQKDDGRIPLWGFDKLIYVDGDCSAIPRIFEVAYDILKRSTDDNLLHDMYLCLSKNLDWWFSSARLDYETGLITGVFEESDPSDCLVFNTKAHVDLNIQVLIGCHVLSCLALKLSYQDDFDKFSKMKVKLADSIHKFMYNHDKGTYHAYLIKEKRIEDRLCSNTFDVLRLNTIPKNRIDRLLNILTDNKYFNWDSFAITSASKTDPEYIETIGDYQGYTSWMGNIWTFRNEIVISALNDIGAFDLSANLAYKTVMEFNNNYAEFISPSDGSPQGVLRYGWTASHYIQLIIEQIFGIEYNQFDKCLRISPNIDNQLYGHELNIQNLSLPCGSKASVSVCTSLGKMTVKYDIQSLPQDFSVIVCGALINKSNSHECKAIDEAMNVLNCDYIDYAKGRKCCVNLGNKCSGEVAFSEVFD